MLSRLTAFLFIIIPLTSTSAQELFLEGGRNTTLGNAVTSSSHPEMIYENVAGLAQQQDPLLVMAVQNRLGVLAFSSVSLGLIYPLKTGTTSLILHQFGDRYYHEQQIGMSYSHRIRYIQLGGRLNYLRKQAFGQPSSGSLIAELGGIVQISEKAIFGAYIYNLNHARDPGLENSFLTTLLKAGLHFQASESLILFTAYSKELEFKDQLHAGLEYRPHEKLYLRFGFQSRPFTTALGLGINTHRLKINYGFAHRQAPGNDHTLSLVFTLIKTQQLNRR